MPNQTVHKNVPQHPSLQIYENRRLLDQRAAEKAAASNAVKEFADMRAKERASGERIVFFRRLVLQHAAMEWAKKHPKN